jgi:hypothetical protein
VTSYVYVRNVCFQLYGYSCIIKNIKQYRTMRAAMTFYVIPGAHYVIPGAHYVIPGLTRDPYKQHEVLFA